MAFICDSCQAIFENDITRMKEIDGTIYCPNRDCGGEVVEIDDLLIPIVTKLWDMELITIFCCSGHPYGLNYKTYVAFDKECWDYDFEFPFLPEGFEITENDYAIFLGSIQTEEERKELGVYGKYHEKLNIILKNVKALNDWILKLEEWLNISFYDGEEENNEDDNNKENDDKDE